MDQRHITGANISSVSQEISIILWNPEIHYCVHDKWPISFYPEPDDSTTHRPTYIEEQLYYYLPIDKNFRMVTLFQVSLRPYI